MSAMTVKGERPAFGMKPGVQRSAAAHVCEPEEDKGVPFWLRDGYYSQRPVGGESIGNTNVLKRRRGWYFDQ